MPSFAFPLSLTLLAFLLFAIPAAQFSPSPSPQPFSPSLGIAHFPLSDLSPSSPSPAIAHSPLSGFSPSSPSPAIAHPDLSPSPAPSDYGASSDHQNSPVEDNGASSDHRNSPSPVPDVDRTTSGDLKTKNGSDDMNGGKKAGIAMGVIGAACVVGVGSVVYKKRQRNIRRSRYTSVTRRDQIP